MKILLVAIALLTIANASFPAYNSWGGINYQRPNFGGYKPVSWGYPPQNAQPTPTTNIEWVCRNPKTNDMMIIASDQSPQLNGYTPSPGTPWQNGVPPGYQGNHPHEQPWVPGPNVNNPRETTEFGTGIDDIQSLPSSPLPPFTMPKNNNNNNNNENNNNNNLPRSTPRYHGGEGSIDIRMGEQ